MTSQLRVLGSGGLFALVALLGAVGCNTTQALQQPRYIANLPDFWQVKAKADGDGQPTAIVIGQYGEAVIDSGSGAITPNQVNYETVTADVEVRVYAWPDSASPFNPSIEVAQTLKANPAQEADLKIGSAFQLLDVSPPECDRFPKKYRLEGLELVPIDLVKRPGWRTIVVGARAKGTLFGVVARVEWESADMLRNCHNLSNMQVQLQNLLDAVTLVSGPPKPVSTLAPLQVGVEAPPASASPAGDKPKPPASAEPSPTPDKPSPPVPAPPLEGTPGSPPTSP